MRKVKRKKSKNRIKISFAATILVLTTITLLAYSFSFRVPSYSIPSNLPSYGGIIGKYAPSDSLQASFENLTAVRAINSSAVLDNQLINLVNPRIIVRMIEVKALVYVTLLNPSLHINNSGEAAVLDGGTFTNLSKAISNSGLVPQTQQNSDLYRVNDSSNGRTKAEWMTLVPGGSSVVFAEGGEDAKAVVLQMLSVFEGNSPSVLTVKNVARMLFAAGGPTHLALSIQNFTGEVRSGNMGLLAVDAANQRVQITHVVRFVSSSFASSQVGEVQAVYKFASDFSQWEECVKAVQSLSLASLQGAVELVAA